MNLHCAVSFRLPVPCLGVCSVGAPALHFVWHLPLHSRVQVSCFERAWPTAVGAFASVLATGSAGPPGRRRPERQRRATAEGKIKGRGTRPRETPVCTRGWHGTRQGRQRAAKVRNAASALAKARALPAGP